ncbi:MAG: hypothetical protein KDB40_04220 [Acidimicrobiales bacterium]|nr:hypothetical protein [Acidimicrobiales bacterium]MCB9393588.1 hypothetical protein [Acidimicrobiaceae bacterium]
MTPIELFERRATRGVARDADTIWHDVRRPPTVADGRRPSWRFRAAVVVWVAAVAIVGVASRSREPDQPVAAPTPVSATSSEPLPAPILVEGGRLRRDIGGVTRPADPGYDADDLFGDRPSAPTPPAGTTPTTTVVFARPDDPFAGPIVGIELLAGGGFRPWAANLASADLDTYTRQLRRVGDEWTMPASSGLVEVARVVDDIDALWRFGWQFDVDLERGRQLTLQAEASSPGREVSEWLWVTRLANSSVDVVRVEPFEVLDHRGVVIGSTGRERDEVVWLDGDFVYRLTSDELVGDTLEPRDVREVAGRLRLVDRDAWVDAVRDSMRTTTTDRVAGVLWLVVVLACAASVLWFVWLRSFAAAALGAAALAELVVELVPVVPSTFTSAVVLALAWWWHRSRSPRSSGSPR